jgi:transposase
MTRIAGSTATRLVESSTSVAAKVADRDIETLTDEALLGALADAADARRALDLMVASLSAEVAHRSTRDRGYDGLAQRHGHRNVTSLVQNITGQTRADVGRALRTGEELAATDVTAPPADDAVDAVPVVPRWQSMLRDALTDGHLATAQYQAIRTGLGEPPVDRYPELDPEFLPEAWADAVSILLREATDVSVEDLRAAARIARDRLDPVGVTLRFEERFAARSFRAWIDENGQHHARIVFDDDAAAWVHGILQAALRPRRGPRFVDPDAAAAAVEVAADERSNEQLQYDALVAVLRTGAAADPGQAFGDRQPGVRIVVEGEAVSPTDDRGGMRVSGVGHFEDGGHAVPGGLVEKYLCDAGHIPISMDGFGRPLDVGREKRLFTRKQRVAIGVREGGCIGPFCNAPISQTEVHHIDQWSRDRGRTDVDDGVPMCRNCHMRLHNQGQKITRERDPQSGTDQYVLHAARDPVTGVIPAPVVLRSKSPRRFRAA